VPESRPPPELMMGGSLTDIRVVKSISLLDIIAYKLNADKIEQRYSLL
jgi:hypothetical protein